jgi:zinc protease
MLQQIRAALCLGVIAVSAPVTAEVKIQEVTSPAGAVFWLVEEPSIPIVAVEMSFQGGSAADPVDRLGVSRFAMGLMDEGAGDLDALAFAAREDEISARMGFSSGTDSVTVGARFLVETLDESIGLLALAMSQPRFDPEPVERLRAQIISGIEQSTKRPSTVAWRTWFGSSLWPPKSRHGRDHCRRDG